MIDADALPIPDWGLRCPNCDAPLAGMPEHRCERCGRAFNIRRLLGVHRPIPDIGLTCSRCGYPLTGLTASRCPECGTAFSVREMIEDQSPTGAVYLTQTDNPPDHHLKKREPTFTGHERPLPDFGLSCADCGRSLTGASADVCPGCGLPFDLPAVVPNGDWVNIRRFVPGWLSAIAKTVLYDARIPYVVDNARLSEVYGGNIPFTTSKLRVPRPFFFDALHALAAADEPAPAYTDAAWTCPSCNEQVPAGFEVCWNCNMPHPGRPADGDG